MHRKIKEGELVLSIYFRIESYSKKWEESEIVRARERESERVRAREGEREGKNKRIERKRERERMCVEVGRAT